MTAISIELPDDLAQSSLEVARGLGLSRSELIRQALERELDQVRAVGERRGIAGALRAMTTDRAVSALADDLDAGLTEGLPAESDGWWQG